MRFGHFQFYGQFDGLNQSVTLSGLQKAKIFQPNLGSGQTSQIDLDFNRGKRPVMNSLRQVYIIFFPAYEYAGKHDTSVDLKQYLRY